MQSVQDDPANRRPAAREGGSAQASAQERARHALASARGAAAHQGGQVGHGLICVPANPISSIDLAEIKTAAGILACGLPGSISIEHAAAPPSRFSKLDPSCAASGVPNTITTKEHDRCCKAVTDFVCRISGAHGEARKTTGSAERSLGQRIVGRCPWPT